MILRCQPMVDAMRECEARFLAESKDASRSRPPQAPVLQPPQQEPSPRQEPQTPTPSRYQSLKVALSPAGKRYGQADALRYAKTDHLILLCGHYEGMDERIYSYTDEIISIGDYVLTGGEVAARVVVDSVLRLLREVIRGESLEEESFKDGLLEYPQYTRPAEYEGKRVPEVLLSGNHAAIRRWREEEAVRYHSRVSPIGILNIKSLKKWICNEM